MQTLFSKTMVKLSPPGDKDNYYVMIGSIGSVAVALSIQVLLQVIYHRTYFPRLIPTPYLRTLGRYLGT